MSGDFHVIFYKVFSCGRQLTVDSPVNIYFINNIDQLGTSQALIILRWLFYSKHLTVDLVIVLMYKTNWSFRSGYKVQKVCKFCKFHTSVRAKNVPFMMPEVKKK